MELGKDRRSDSERRHSEFCFGWLLSRNHILFFMLFLFLMLQILLEYYYILTHIQWYNTCDIGEVLSAILCFRRCTLAEHVLRSIHLNPDRGTMFNRLTHIRLEAYVDMKSPASCSRTKSSTLHVQPRSTSRRSVMISVGRSDKRQYAFESENLSGIILHRKCIKQYTLGSVEPKNKEHKTKGLLSPDSPRRIFYKRDHSITA